MDLGARATKLYLVDGVLASRKGHQLKHLSQSGNDREIRRGRTVRLTERLKGAAGKGPARGARRRDIVGQILEQGQDHLIDPATRKILDKVAGAIERYVPT